MTEQYRKGLYVMDYLQGVGLNMTTIGEAISDENLEKSYNTIKDNPTITKSEFLRLMQIEEWED